jgi:hypothetical protein
MHGDWVVAIATVIGAVIGALIAVVVWYLSKDRRRVRFVLNEPQDLAAPLRAKGNFEIKFGDRTTRELVSAGTMIENMGNTVIKDFECEIVIPGTHNLCLAEVLTSDDKLRSAVNITFAEGLPQQDPWFKIKMAFFNPGESFHVRTLADGVMQPSNITCRLPGLRTKIVNEGDVLRQKKLAESVAGNVAAGVGAAVGLSVAGGAVAGLSAAAAWLASR